LNPAAMNSTSNTSPLMIASHNISAYFEVAIKQLQSRLQSYLVGILIVVRPDVGEHASI
jgi:hypothetical protein